MPLLQISTGLTLRGEGNASTICPSVITRWAISMRREDSTVSLFLAVPSLLLSRLPVLNEVCLHLLFCFRLCFPNLFAEILIEKEPSNLQAQSLQQLIEKGVARGKQFSRLISPVLHSDPGHLTTLPSCRGLHRHGLDGRSGRSRRYRGSCFAQTGPKIRISPAGSGRFAQASSHVFASVYICNLSTASL